MMEDEYHDLALLAEVDEQSLQIPRAKALCVAIGRHPDAKLLKILRLADGATSVEVLVFELACDGVPSQNKAGIRYRERLALFVSPGEKEIPDVVALRRGFPVLIHQNQGHPEAAAVLCVYFGPKAAVLRTWTPESFLNRIQWWLEASARAELHPIDQPVEQLFFSSKYELVLPWNAEELAKSSEHRAVISRGSARPDGGITCFLRFVPKDAKPDADTLAHIEVTLPPVEHGFIMRDPPTLGALADMLSARGVDLLSPLRKMFEGCISASGAAAASDDTFTIVLLNIPIIRAEEEAAERLLRKAFFTSGGRLAIGEALGAYFLHDGKYFDATGLLGPHSTKWRDVHIEGIDVLQRSSAATARSQSGIDDEGPAGVVVGAGALGGNMLGFWGRAGWGRWTVIDHDHIKPHNLVRHPALGGQVGHMKANALAELHAATMDGASILKPIAADACDFLNSEVINAIEAAQLVVDASTTLEYPRLASKRDGIARHVSVFLTPSGNCSVMLAEDAERKLRLRTLEAQYYRAVINKDWGSSHLDGNLRHFWSGASCRDISVVMPYSKIAAHAATLAEQVRWATKQPNACIRVWQRDPDTGSVSVHEVDAYPEHEFALGQYALFIDDGVYTKLHAMRATRLPEETGGILLGYYDLSVQSVIVVDALPAPPDSKTSRLAFERGISGLKEVVIESSRRTANIVQYIGEWHSHPSGYSARPSADDAIQLVYLALHMAKDGLPAVQIIVGDQDISVLQATVAE